MLPRFKGSGVRLQGLTTLALGYPQFSLAPNDIVLLPILSSNEPIATPTGFTEFVPASPQGIGVAATADSSRLGIFWKRLIGNEVGTVNIADSGDHTAAVMLLFDRCIKTGTPIDPTFDATWGGTAPTSTVFTFPGKTTTLKDVLMVLFGSHGLGNGTSQWGAFSSPDLGEFFSIFAAGIGNGLGGGYTALCGKKQVPGAYSAVTGSIASTSQQTWAQIPLLGDPTDDSIPDEEEV